MADALISPPVGGAMWAVTAGLTAWCARKVRTTMDERMIPMMGVLGAFIFTAQMINFSIPGTGSSGHLGGGMILAILLGPYAAFVVIASVLTVQALFFADGGLLALGCNIFNLGFFPAFVAYPLIYRPLVKDATVGPRLWIGAGLASVVGLQLGAFGVVLETVASGISELPFRSFLMLMQPIHLAIGLVEGLATAAVVSFVAQTRPEALAAAQTTQAATGSFRRAIIGLAAAAVVIGGAFSWFASTHPDGLEWAMAKVSGKEELATPDGVHASLAHLQETTAFLPDYGFKASETEVESAEAPAAWPSVSGGTSTAGLVGGMIVLALAGLTGLALKTRCRESQA
jgi:cobalt/nickel transport system permease protein